MGGIDRLDSYCIAFEGNLLGRCGTLPEHPEGYGCAHLATHNCANLAVVYAYDRGVAHREYGIAHLQARLASGGVFAGGDDPHGVPHNAKLHAHTAKRPFVHLHLALHLLGADIGGVGVEAFEHGAYCLLDESLVVGLLDIERVEIVIERVEFLQLVPKTLSCHRACAPQQNNYRNPKSFHYFKYSTRLSNATFSCVPSAIFLTVATPSVRSLSPTMITKGIALLLAYSICFFIFALSG